MGHKGFKRKLSAILSADVKGYSRLMGDDEEATVSTIKAYRAVINDLAQQYRGRIVDSPGDNILAEFGSVVDAVNCAVDVQRELAERNAELPDNRRMQFRIGVNLGDVIKDGERIYGDGVNIAARIEAMAEPGGLCISGLVYNQVHNRLKLKYQYLGEKTLKNIKDSVQVYRVLPFVAGAKPTELKAAIERMAFPLPEKPSIAVLPFNNMSGDPQQEYIGDGLCENIITSLSKIGRMFVIARNSSFIYKNKSVKVQHVAEELGVQYVLEGSVQKVQKRIRVNAQLIDALNGHHLWSDRYDRQFKDLFELQDEITQKIALSLHVELTRGEAALLESRSTNNIEAWGNVAKGYDLFMKINRENNLKARTLFENATALDKNYASAWAWLAFTYYMDIRFMWGENRPGLKEQMNEFLQKALSLDKKDPVALLVEGQNLLLHREHEKAIIKLKECIANYPSYSGAFFNLSVVLFYSGQFGKCVEMIKKAMRFCPYYPAYYLRFLGASYGYLKQYDEAVATFIKFEDRCQKDDSPALWGLLGLAWIYEEIGEHEEACCFVEKALNLDPNLSLADFKKEPFKVPDHLDRLLKALNQAGLP